MDKEFNWATDIAGWTLKADEDEWHWAKQPSGSINLPDFIQLRAKGEAKITDGHVYLKKPGPDPELMALLNEGMKAAEQQMQEEITKSLYEGNEAITKCTGLAGLLNDKRK